MNNQNTNKPYQIKKELDLGANQESDPTVEASRLRGGRNWINNELDEEKKEEYFTKPSRDGNNCNNSNLNNLSNNNLTNNNLSNNNNISVTRSNKFGTKTSDYCTVKY